MANFPGILADSTNRSDRAITASDTLDLLATATPGDNSTKAASTAYADAIAALKSNLASPIFTTKISTPRTVGTGTSHVAGDYVLSAGWGNTATVSAVAARDSAGRVSITCNGTGILANPTVTLTYKDGTWTVAPVSLPVRADINAPSTATFVPTSDTATTAVWTFLGTPVAASIYTVSFLTGGK